MRSMTRYVAVGAMALALAACSGDGDDVDSTPSTPPTTSQSGPYSVEIRAIPASTQPPRGLSGTHTLEGRIANNGEGMARTLTDEEFERAELYIDSLVPKADEPLSMCTGLEAMHIEIVSDGEILYNKTVDQCSEGTEWGTVKNFYSLLGE